MRVLLTNDDGIDAEGLRRLRDALLDVDGLDLLVIAPDSDRSAIGRGITFRRPVTVERRAFEDGSTGFACDGTPVDCVRLADLGLDEGGPVDLVVSGINHGSNLGDDITYSGTVAAGLEGVLLGMPAIAVSLQMLGVHGPSAHLHGAADPFGAVARFTARLVAALEDVPLPPATMLNVNAPAGEIRGVEVARLGKRVYHDTLQPEGEIAPDRSGRYVIYNAMPSFEDEPGTDLAAVDAGCISVTPMHLDLTMHDGIGPLSMAQLDRMLAPATEELER